MAQLSEKKLSALNDLLADGLSSQKSATEKFNTFAGECVHDSLRGTMINILEQEHNISKAVFNMMYLRGMYESTPAKEKKSWRQCRNFLEV